MNTRLNEFLEENNVINKCQIGFRKHHRTADHLLVLKTLIDFYKSHRKPIFACFIDFKKAYDSVWRKGLLFKLISCGCSKTFLRFISNMYSSVNYSVKLKDGVTPPFQSYIGLKQGCNLSPTLFNIFINDMPNLFNQSCDPVRLDNTDLSCLLYADDLILLSESKAGLQKCLSKLEIYAKKWILNINKKKSKILVFGTANQRRTYLLTKWYYENEALEQVDEYCYLGITIHFSGNFKKALKVLRDKALRAYNHLLKKFSNFENVPIKIRLKLFSAMIIPILLYRCEICGPYLIGRVTTFEIFKSKFFKIINEIERIHLKFCKRILGVHSKTTNLTIYAELGKVPLIVQISTLVVKYWIRISSIIIRYTFNNTLSGEARNVCVRLNLKPIVFLQFLLKVCKLEMKDFEKFSNTSDESTNTRRSFCHYLNVTLTSEFTSFWKDQVLQNGDSGKLKEYKKLKVNVGIEKYFLEIKNFKYRQAVTRLRVSAHRLPVEIGRYKKIAYCDMW